MNSNMLKYFISGLVIFFVAVFYCGNILGAEEMTGGEFVIKLVRSIGLDYKLSPDAGVNDYIAMLEKEGIVMPLGFDPAKPMTKEQKADLLARVLNIETGKEDIAQMITETYRDKAVIKELSGNVLVKRKGETDWIPAKIDMELIEQDSVKTGPASTVLLRVGIAGRVEIKENSELILKNISTQINKKSENILIYLAMGEAKVDVRFIEKDTVFETVTPTTLAAVRGTIYIVRVLPAEGKTEIRQE